MTYENFYAVFYLSIYIKYFLKEITIKSNTRAFYVLKTVWKIRQITFYKTYFIGATFGNYLQYIKVTLNKNMFTQLIIFVFFANDIPDLLSSYIKIFRQLRNLIFHT